MTRWLRAALDLLLPRMCPPCGTVLRPGTRAPLCSACSAALIPRPAAACPRCAGAPDGAGDACCSCRREPPAFTSARALGPYIAGPSGNTLARTIQHLKYRDARVLAAPLADLLARDYPFDAHGVLVPVPLHLSRLRARGYNQALLLARGLARRRGLRLAPRLLERTRATTEHATLGAAARRANVRDAFRVRPGQRVPRTVILIDDVLTTGATAEACAQALLEAGARVVHVYTVGRTPRA